MILDDDQQIADLLKGLLERFFPQFKSISTVHSGREASLLLSEESFDLLLLDVELGNGESTFDYFDGFHVGQAKVIFVTGHPDYAIEAIRQNAVDYVLKPIQLAEFKNAIAKVIQRIETDKKELTLNELQERQQNRITISELDQIRLLTLQQIEAFEANGPYTHIHMLNGDMLTSSKHLKYYEDLVSASGFYRVHNSFVINILHIASINKRDGASVIFQSGKEVVISTRRKEDFLAYIARYIALN
jgi:two-component system LytT family response regulator